MTKPYLISCSMAGGRSRKTGLPVGQRHRWSGPKWGEGKCIFCGRDLQELLQQPSEPISMQRAIANDQAEAARSDWHATFWDGSYASPRGWYIVRKPASGATEWLYDAEGKLVRRDTEEAARAAIPAADPQADGRDPSP